MLKLVSEADKVCVAKAAEADQGHVFDGWDDLPPEAQRLLIRQVERIDFQLVKRLVQQHIHTVAGPVEGRALQPAPLTGVPQPGIGREEYELCRTLGEYALRSGEVLVVTAAGGRGLPPLSEPVGMLPVGPVSGKSVFALHAEKILALSRRYRKSIQWKIFCRPADIDKVGSFFKAHGFFGLKASDVSFEEQPVLPVVDRRGKIIRSGPGQLAMSPSGHGSILLHFLQDEPYQALVDGGIRHLFYFQVDNPLVPIAEAEFVGLHIRDRAEVSSKAVRKLAPDEAVGVFCQYNGTIGVVEYTELSREDREARLPDGTLAFSAGNIGVHLFAVEFLSRMREEGLQLPFHRVDRITPFLSRRGTIAKPAEPNSIEFGAFIFDAIALARRSIVTEVPREDQFSPIKSPGGACSPQTAQRDLSRLYARWLKACGALPPGVEPDQMPCAVEISPLHALDVEELRSKVDGPVDVGADILLGGRR